MPNHEPTRKSEVLNGEPEVSREAFKSNMTSRIVKAHIRYDSMLIDVEGTSGEVSDLIFRLKKGGLPNAEPVIRMESVPDKPMPDKDAIAAFLRTRPDARHSVKDLMMHFLGVPLSPRRDGRSNPDYLRFLARVKAARDDLEREAKRSFTQEKDGKEVFYRLK